MDEFYILLGVHIISRSLVRMRSDPTSCHLSSSLLFFPSHCSRRHPWLAHMNLARSKVSDRQFLSTAVLLLAFRHGRVLGLHALEVLQRVTSPKCDRLSVRGGNCRQLSHSLLPGEISLGGILPFPEASGEWSPVAHTGSPPINPLWLSSVPYLRSLLTVSWDHLLRPK